jgi:hypothetical protein
MAPLSGNKVGTWHGNHVNGDHKTQSLAFLAVLLGWVWGPAPAGRMTCLRT